MIYIKGLYDTYNKLEEQGLIGYYDEDGLGIFPKYHNIKGIDKGGSAFQVHINSVDGSYNVHKLQPRDAKGKIYLVYPTTIESNARNSEPSVPHGVSEELKYLSLNHTGTSNNYTTYLNNLNEWLTFTKGDTWVKTVYNFMEWTGQSSEQDIESIILSVYPDEKISNKTFVTFVVDNEDISNSKRLQDMWVDYLEAKYSKGYEGFKSDYDDLTGTIGIVPNKYTTIIGTAKVLSKSSVIVEPHVGRFVAKGDISEIYTLTHETTQKAYNILAYLLNAKGKNAKWVGADTTLLMWMDGDKIQPEHTIEEEIDEFCFEDDEIQVTDTIIQEYLNNITSGQIRKDNINTQYNVYILMIVKTNNGRVAIKKYQKLTDLGYQDVLNYWYATTSWGNLYNDNKYTTLSLRGLVNNLFGHEEDNGKYYNLKVNKGFEGKAVSLIEELIEAKMNKQRLPSKFYKKAMGNAKQRHRYPNTWEKTLMTTLSMYKKYQWDYKNKYVGVDVELENQSNGYLYGRLMAVYEQIESSALYYKGITDRQTFVEKNWSSIINRPLYMWNRMHVKSQPYMKQLMNHKPAVGQKYKNLILEIGTQLTENEDFDTKGKKQLTDDFILGYYHQLKALRTKKPNTQEEEINE